MKTIPFSLLPPEFLRRISPIFNVLGSRLENAVPQLKLNLKKAKIDFSAREYLNMCITSTFLFVVVFGLLGMFFAGGFKFTNANQPLVTGMATQTVLFSSPKNIFGIIAIVLILAVFIFFQQISYPKLRAYQNIKNIDRNILPAMQNILIQLNSGAPLFDAIVSVSSGDYGGVSEQFKIAVRKINAGENQIRALEDLAEENPSPYFRRAIWQITTGMKTGSDITKILENTISDLSEEQVIQIQRYGSQLNPLAMFYMLIAVILPSLGITFIMVLAAFANMGEVLIKIIIWSLLLLVFFF